MDNKSKNQGIPTFTPPEDGAPVFTPPKTPQHDGPVCYHHPSEPAVARCARCGKYICNSYAQAVRDNGEAAADAALRQATTRIAENGEIIRDFPGAAAA